MDGTAVDNTKLPWLPNEPNNDVADREHCGSIYKRGVDEDECYNKNKFICKIGPTACGPKGKLALKQVYPQWFGKSARNEEVKVVSLFRKMFPT